MDFSKLPLFALISQRMGWLSERQKILAENVANADTPNYQARDLKAPDFKTLAGAASARLQPVATAPGHLSPRGGAGGATVVTAKGGEKTLSGNTVSIESEMMKVAETAMDYQLITNLYRKQIGMLRTVIGRGQS